MFSGAAVSALQIRVLEMDGINVGQPRERTQCQLNCALKYDSGSQFCGVLCHNGKGGFEISWLGTSVRVQSGKLTPPPPFRYEGLW